MAGQRVVAIYRVWQAGAVKEISFEKQPVRGAARGTPESQSAGATHPSGAHVRISDADRDHVAEILHGALGEGRLTPEEHAERVEAAYAAKTSGQLEPLLRDLPAGRRRASSPPPAKESSSMVAVFSGASRKGRWRVGRKLSAFACFGGVEIDLTEALYDHREVVIEATSLFGYIDIRVPENVTLRNAGSGVMGGFEVDERESEDPDAPVVIVEGLALFAGVEAKARKGKRIRDLRASRPSA